MENLVAPTAAPFIVFHYVREKGTFQHKIKENNKEIFKNFVNNTLCTRFIPRISIKERKLNLNSVHVLKFSKLKQYFTKLSVKHQHNPSLVLIFLDIMDL